MDKALKNYDALIEAKVKTHTPAGFKPEKIKAKLFDWQKQVVNWAIETGRAALFEECGLGKTLQQLEWARQVAKWTAQPVLILCPLAVAKQTVREGEQFGIEVNHALYPGDIKPGINITNYDRVEAFAGIVPSLSGIVLDESSILKNFMGKTRLLLTELFSNTPYRLCCTATPSPNDFMELGQHCEFLGVMPSNEMLSRWFINDTMNFGTYRIKGHAKADFWRWVSSWAACIFNPADIGFKCAGYDLPPLELIQHTIQIDEVTGADGELFRATKVSATNLHKESRFSIRDRCAKAAEIATSENNPCVIWCELNDEADILKKLMPTDETVEVRGSQMATAKERDLDLFTTGQRKFIITKKEIGGFGLNWQHCWRQVHVGQSFSMEQEYQGIRRCHRFGQKHPVKIHLITPSTLGDVRMIVRNKFEQHAEMQAQMKMASKSFGKRLELSMEKKLKTHTGPDWTLHQGDCVRAAKQLKDNSIDFSVYSPPFANLYIYSSDVQDMGNCNGHGEFMEQYAHAIREKYRITNPGCLTAVHCKQTVRYAGRDGAAGLTDFRGMIITAHEKEGWVYHSEVVIWKDPVIEMQRTKAQGLLFKQLCKDSRYARMGMPEYVIVFRKWEEGMDKKAIPHDDKKPWDYIGSSGPNPMNHKDTRGQNIEVWQRYASPVWMDIRQTNVLNIQQAREQNDEKHICPLQLDVIERCLWLWSNKGDTIWSPFTGIGSEGYCALKMGRKFVGSELKASYCKTAIANLNAANSQRTLFEEETV